MTAALERVLNCPVLPSLPAVAVQVLAMTRDPNVTVKELARVVENDQAISTKVLRTINSSYYGLSSPCPSIHRAMGYLGLNTVRSLVLGFSLVDSFKGSETAEGFDIQRHWRRALYGAVAARTIAHQACCTDPDEAFISAMLQDVGMLAAAITLGTDYEAVSCQIDGDHFAAEDIEQSALDFTHSQAGAQLAQRWSLPEGMIEAIRNHHDPDNASQDHRDLARIVALSAVAAEALTVDQPQQLVRRLERDGRAWFDLPEDGVAQMLTRISEGAGELSRLFQLDTGTAPDIASIMSQAQEQQIAAQASMDRERQSLETTATELERQSMTDGLTGIANRRGFDKALEAEFDRAKQGGALAVIFFDADRFKALNDTHGHQVGDEVLIQIAARATEAIGDAGHVFRYGGEEFAIVAPGADRAAGSRLAESIRKAIESHPFDLVGVPDCPDELPVTVSLGVASLEPAAPDAFADAAALLKAADTAVYAAKKGGRNCTRVYNASKAKSAPTLRENPPAREAPEHRPMADGGDLSVLLIVDDALQRSLMKSMLNNIAGIDACVASSGEEALSMLGLNDDAGDQPQIRPDITLCNLNGSTEAGLGCLRVIRDAPQHAPMPLIVVGDSDSPESVRSCMAAGATAFLSKQDFAESPDEFIAHLIGFWASAKIAA